MPRDEAEDSIVYKLARWPWWSGYVIAVLSELALTVLLIAVNPYLPLGEYPITYAILLMAIAYLFGEGPAILVFFLSLFSFDYFFLSPVYNLWPIATSPRGWAGFAAFILNTFLVTFATLIVRRDQRRIHKLIIRLREGREKLANMTNTVPAGILMVDTSDRILFCNEAAITMLGKPREQIIGQTFSAPIWCMSSINGEPISDADRPYVQVIRTGEPIIGIECAIGHTDGSRVIVSVNAAPMLDPDGSIAAVVIALSDITETYTLRQAISRQFTLLQKALTPGIPSIGEGYRIAARYIPAFTGQEIGGDFYDVFDTRQGQTGFLIGDVSGKGIKAAALGSSTRSTIHAFAYELTDPGEVMMRANAVLCKQYGDPEEFVTAFLVLLDKASSRVSYSSAGHPPPAIYRADGSVEYLMLGNLPVCLIDGYEFTESETVLQAGEKIILYTDGVMEARNDMQQTFDLEGIKSSIEKNGYKSADDLAESLLCDARQWAGGKLQDDVAILVVERIECTTSVNG